MVKLRPGDQPLPDKNDLPSMYLKQCLIERDENDKRAALDAKAEDERIEAARLR